MPNGGPVEVGAAGGEAPPEVSAAIGRAAGGGEPLAGRIRTSMEDAFGADFSAVRIHRDSSLAPRLGALAFTSGADIHFARGQYAPERAAGQHVLGHELAHVVQQSAAPTRVRRARSAPSDVDRDSRRSAVSGRIRRSTAPAVQRLVGFEVELSVPTIGAVPGPALNPNVGGAVPNPNIGTFFGGGLIYATPIGQLATFHGPIAMKSDHNKLQTRARALYQALNVLPSNVPLAPLAPAVGYVALSNLEYSTPALDELAAGSNGQFLALANMIDWHTQQILNNQPANQLSWIPMSNPQTATGVPVPELTAWLGAPLPGGVPAALAALLNQIGWSMYVQATVGVLPSGLATMYAQRAAAAPAPALGEAAWTTAKRDAGNAIVNGVNLLFADAAFQAQIAPLPNQGERDALKGLMLVGLAYTIGNAINQTTLLSSTRKNAVPLLIKFADIGNATNLASTNWLRGNLPAGVFIQNVATFFHQNVAQANLAYWTGPPHNAPIAPLLLPGGAPTDRGLLHGIGFNAIADTASMLTRLLTGAGGVTTVAPGVGALPAADPVSPTIAGLGAGGQAGLPVEYRWIRQRPNAAGQLWAVMQQVLLEARMANLSHLTAVQAAPIAAAW